MITNKSNYKEYTYQNFYLIILTFLLPYNNGRKPYNNDVFFAFVFKKNVLAVKTDKPVKKSEIFDIMKIINGIVLCHSVKIGDIIKENISEDINLIATNNIEISMLDF